MVSVGATEDVLMAACLAAGETVGENAAREPEIGDLARCLTAMGADIDGIGSSTLTVRGVERLHEADHEIIADRIEAGTYAMAVPGATTWPRSPRCWRKPVSRSARPPPA
jgi:UDP-N-acetylglucosamine 1-carboxyvinyltransferase